MFEIVEPNEVRSTDGFSVRVCTMGESLEYVESDGRKAILVFGKESPPVGTPPIGNTRMILYGDTLKKWESPHDAELLSPERHAEVLQRIASALDCFKIPFKWRRLHNIVGRRFESEVGFAVEILDDQRIRYLDFRGEMTIPVHRNGVSGMKIMLQDNGRFDDGSTTAGASAQIVQRLKVALSALGIEPVVVSKQ
jgi:hypothetical protein